MHRIVGLDLSSDAVRLVALESGFRGFQVVRMAQAKLAAVGGMAERLQQALPQLADGLPLGGDAVAVSLPGAQVASFPMTLPFTDARRIEQVLPAEIEGAIPFDLDEVVWDYAVLAQEEGRSELLVAVVRKKALREALDALSAAGVDPKVVTFAPLALAALGERKLLAAAPGADDRAQPEVDLAAVARGEAGEAGDSSPAAVAILEAGPDRADFCMLRGGQTELARSLPAASLAAWETAAIDETMTAGLLAPLVRDLKITLRTRAVKKGPPLSRLLLAGQLAHLPGAAERLSAELGVRCEPLALSPDAHAPGTADPAAHALALGLALRAQQPRGRLNFRKDEFAFTKDVSHLRGQVVRLSVAALAVLILALFFGIARLSAVQRLAKSFDEALCRSTEQILRKCYTDYREALGALRGSNSRAGGVPRVSATEILAEVTNALPESALPALEDVEITTSRVTLKGAAEGVSQIETITNALKKGRCFGDIRPARSERVPNSQKWSFVIDFSYVCSGEQAGGA